MSNASDKIITPLSLILGLIIKRYRLDVMPAVKVLKSKKKKIFKRIVFLKIIQKIMHIRKIVLIISVVSWLKKFNLEFSPKEIPVKIIVLRSMSVKSPATTCNSAAFVFPIFTIP